MPSGEIRHVFGPVNSRRLGLSLGIDLIPYKTCTYSCIYCQLGRTTNLCLHRQDYVPTSVILAELDRKLDSGLTPAYITLAGSGEPTLHARLGNLINGIKKRTSIPIAVLTNGSLLWRKKVRHELKEADIVIPSLDAGNERMFQYVNRPHKDLTFDKVVSGMELFLGSFPGRVWLEVFVLGGVTDRDDEIQQMVEITKRIGPEKIQLNTVARPPAEDYAFAVPLERLSAIAKAFGTRCETVAGQSLEMLDAPLSATNEDVLNLLKRRPCSSKDVAIGLCIPLCMALKLIDGLVEEGKVQPDRHGLYTVPSR